MFDLQRLRSADGFMKKAFVDVGPPVGATHRVELVRGALEIATTGIFSDRKISILDLNAKHKNCKDQYFVY